MSFTFWRIRRTVTEFNKLEWLVFMGGVHQRRDRQAPQVCFFIE